MLHAALTHITLDDWITREALPFTADAHEMFQAAVDSMLAQLGDSVDLLGFGEALHGGEEFLMLRNRLFERLVTRHGYTAIALESSFPKAQVINEYILGRGPASYEDVQDTGFGHGFGRLAANCELIEWMRGYNADPTHPVKLRFYGCDIPDCATGIASPRQVIDAVVAYLESLDSACAQAYRERIAPLLGQDFDWENPAMYADYTKSIGLSPAASALRIELEDLVTELRIRQPELIEKSSAFRYNEALQYASVARQLLTYHAAHARNAGFAHLLGIRDALIAENLVYSVACEQGRGKVLVFAHNSHLKRGMVVVWPSWQKALGADAFAWWPAGAHLEHLLGARYAVIGSALGISEANGIAAPEVGTIEARLLMAAASAACFIPTYRGRRFSPTELAALPTRSESIKNLSYIPLGPQSLSEFDWLACIPTSSYSRGGQPLPEQASAPE